MGFAPYYKNQIIKVVDTAEEIYLGGYTLSSVTELQWMRIAIYKHGVTSGSERLRLGVYSRADMLGNLFYSDWIDVADFDTGDYWLGYVRFDFSRQNLDAGIEYHVGMQTDNYTRNGDAYYISAVSDWPDPVNEIAGASSKYFAARCPIFGYR